MARARIARERVAFFNRVYFGKVIAEVVQPNFAKFDVAANDWVWTQQIGMNVTLSYAENKQKYGMAMDLLQAVKV